MRVIRTSAAAERWGPHPGPGAGVCSALHRTVLLCVLSESPLLRALPPQELERIADRAVCRLAGRGERFFREGEPARDTYVLVRGAVKLLWSGRHGHDVMIGVARRGDAFGYVSALASSAYVLTAEAAEKSEALAIDADTLLEVFSRHPRCALAGLRILARQLIDAWCGLEMLATERVERRIARMLLKWTPSASGASSAPEAGTPRAAGGRVRLSHQDIAELTGTTPYTVSRVMARWKQAGLVSVGRASVTICDAERLARMLEDPMASPRSPGRRRAVPARKGPWSSAPPSPAAVG
jgi:CRP-like cAMP-binding protein